MEAWCDERVQFCGGVGEPCGIVGDVWGIGGPGGGQVGWRSILRSRRARRSQFQRHRVSVVD